MYFFEVQLESLLSLAPALEGKVQKLSPWGARFQLNIDKRFNRNDLNELELVLIVISC